MNQNHKIADPRVRSRFSIACLAMIWAAALPGISSAQDGTKPRLDIAIGAPSAAYGALWIALGENLFEKHGVDVNVVNYHAISTGSAMLVSGQIDIFGHSPMGGIRIAQQGKPISYVMSLGNQKALFNTLVGKQEIRDIAQLQALGTNCRMASTPPGSGLAAITVAYIRAFDLKCTLDVVGTTAMLSSGVASGQYDAAIVQSQDGYMLKAEGKANILVDPAELSEEEIKRIYPFQHPYLVLSGVPGNLQAKREGVVRFIGALREGMKRLDGMTAEEAAEIQAKIKEAVGGIPIESLVAQWKLVFPTLPEGPDAGSIREENWSDLLESAPLFWSITDLAGSKEASYQNMVDMSFFEEAK